MGASTKELTVFWRKWGRMLSSGVPILTSLDVLKQETANAELQQAIGTLHDAIREGDSIVNALDKAPNLFSLSVRSMVKTAEMVGTVQKMCTSIADGIEEGTLAAEAEPADPKADKKVNDAKVMGSFWRKCGRMLDAGMPLARTLDIIQKETAHRELQDAVGLVHAAIMGGSSFEQALAKAPALFPPSVRAIIHASEIGGRVEQACFTIAAGIKDGGLLTDTVAPLPGICATGPKSGQSDYVSGPAEEDVPVIKLASTIIYAAHKERASDVHLECTEGDLRVRFRVDGVLRNCDGIPRRLSEAVISRFKIMSGLNVAEKRLPQDGRIIVNIEGQEVDMRVSCIPSLDGENIVLRLLTGHPQLLKLEAQDFTAPQLSMLRGWLGRPHGLILVTGPTGCGKTTTLYSMVQEINRPDRKILMAEDPVEMRIPGVTQLQVRQSLGLTFTAALRSFMRQDPDVIAATEIRDLETAHILVQAALTGHLALSTLHTQDASAALQRIIDIGVAPFLLNSTLVGVIAQRLVRQVCAKCKEEYQPESCVRESVTLPAGARFYRGKGCEHCSKTGYRGRIAIHEVLEMNDVLRKAVKDDAGPAGFRQFAARAGMISLRDDGIAKALAGLTTLEEVLIQTGGQ